MPRKFCVDPDGSNKQTSQATDVFYTGRLGLEGTFLATAVHDHLARKSATPSSQRAGAKPSFKICKAPGAL